MIPILRKEGLKSYYYVGDTGSQPNHAFYGGKMLGDDLVGFPVMTFRKVASMAEMSQNGWNEKMVEEAFLSLLEYVRKHRNIRLWYSHPYDIYYQAYKSAVRKMFDRLVQWEKEGKIQSYNMTEATRFIQALWNTERHFRWSPKGIDVTFRSGHPFRKDLWFALPKNYQGKTLRPGTRSFREIPGYYLFPLPEGKREFHHHYPFVKGPSPS
jgi:hypothetical protein